MMGKLHVDVLLLGLVASFVLIHAVESMEEIEVDNPYMDDHWPDAEWGYEEHCSSGKAFAFDMKYEQPGAVDATAVNAVKLYCRDESGVFTDSITSFEGKYGDYMGQRSCPGNDKMTGYRLQVWPYQGTFGDDWAVDNVQIQCSSNTTLDGMGNSVFEEQMVEDSQKVVIAQSLSEHMEVVDMSINSRSLIHGDWTDWAFCSHGYYICGLQTLVGQGHPFSDDTGLTHMRLFCSSL